MKDICKKLIIMIVMVLGIIGGYNINAFADESFEIGTSNLNGTTENSAKVGDKLLKPEIGWKRYDDRNKKIIYLGIWKEARIEQLYKQSFWYSNNLESHIKFKFYGNKLRLISLKNNKYSDNINIKIDNKLMEYSCYDKGIDGTSINVYQILTFENLDLENGVHFVDIYLNKESINNQYNNFNIDAIDINSDGELLEYQESIDINKSLLTLQEGTSKDLVAITTPEAVNVVWSSSDESVATVDQNGKVTGIKEGTCTITATIDGTDIKDICEVIVTKEEPPIEPEEPTGEGSLYIEMIDGNIKQAQDLDVDDFIKWFKDRDLDDTENPLYKIKNAKGNIEYLVHDKVVGFEIR